MRIGISPPSDDGQSRTSGLGRAPTVAERPSAEVRRKKRILMKTLSDALEKLQHPEVVSLLLTHPRWEHRAVC